MLRIRKAQMEDLSKAMLDQFENRMEVHLRANFPEKTRDKPGAEFHTLIKSGIKKAREYGVIAEDDVRRYLELIVVYGTDFDTNPRTSWAGDILRTEDLDGSAKIDRLDEYDLFMSIRNMT